MEIEIKERILQEAKNQFFRLGVSRVRMEDLAHSLGMSKKTLYLHYKSKDELLQAVVDAMFQDHQCCIEKFIASEELNFVAKLRNIMLYIASQNAKLSDGVLQDLKRNAPSIWKQIEAWRKQNIFTQFKALVEAGMKEGIFRKDIPIDLVVTIYYNAIHYTIHPDNMDNVNYSVSDAFSSIFKLTMEGLLTYESKKEFSESLLDLQNA